MHKTQQQCNDCVSRFETGTNGQNIIDKTIMNSSNSESSFHNQLFKAQSHFYPLALPLKGLGCLESLLVGEVGVKGRAR